MDFVKKVLKQDEQVKTEFKKGTNSWKPASLNEFSNKDPNFRYRMVNKEPNNIAKKFREGWQVVSEMSDSNLTQKDPNKIEYGKNLTSVNEGKDWILMKLPEEGEQSAKGRDAMMNKKSADRIRGLTAHLRSDMVKAGAGDAEVRGSIKVENKYGTQVID